MNRFPKSTWIGAGLFDLVGVAAVYFAVTGEGGADIVTLSAGIALLACSGLLFVIRLPALLLAGLTASVLLLEFGPTAFATGGAVTDWPTRILTSGGIVVLFFAAAAIGGRSPASGGC
jgi:hypothetical protein